MEKIVAKPNRWTILCGLFGLKLLLSFCYVSTDFEVHRNWLAITYNLPLNKWYLENTSIWTLDYPPYFAWFEYGLAQFGALVLLNDTVAPAPRDSPLGIRPENVTTADIPTVIFQRFTVVLADLVFVVGVFQCIGFMFTDESGRCAIPLPASRKPVGEYCLWLLLCCNVGLIFVDNIHFQYNGFLFGFLLLSMACVGKERYILGALLFAILLNLKHIFLYLAPAYAAFYFRNYCFPLPAASAKEKKSKQRPSSAPIGVIAHIVSFSPFKFLKLLTAGGVVFIISFLPFIYFGQLPQVLSRLFPFKRGLSHAYWAPNFWALYNAADYMALIIFKRLGWIGDVGSVPGYATGLVQEFDHLVLPSIKPLTTFLITALTMAPACLIAAVKRSKWDCFVHLITLCAFSSFLFGWHVHEKAILMILVPLSLLTMVDYGFAKIFLLLSAAGHFSLFPLLFQQFESPIRYSAFFIYIAGTFWGLQSVYRLPSEKCLRRFVKLPFCNAFETLYVYGFVPLEIACTFMHYHPALSKKFTFAPLMLTSLYCAIGVVYCWLLLYWTFLRREMNLDTRYLMKRGRKERLLLKEKLRTESDVSWQQTSDGSFEQLRLVGGLDVSTANGDSVNAIGCLAVLSFPDLKVVHSMCQHVAIRQPYIPGYLAFREGRIMISLVERLRKERPDLLPQVLFVDGNGLLHPDRFGLACHVGVLVDIPTVGVAKDLHLVEGIVRPSPEDLETGLREADTMIQLKDDTGQTLAAAVRTRNTSKNPIFVSVGHRINLDAAVKLTVQCSKHRVPEPIRAADTISRERVRQELL